MVGIQIHGKELIRLQVQGQPKNLLVLRNYESRPGVQIDPKLTKLFDAHPLVESFNAEHGTHLSVVSHRVADIALDVQETCNGLGSDWHGTCFPVDASIAYEKPRVKFGKEIVFEPYWELRVILATGKYTGEWGAALVALGLTIDDFAYKRANKLRTVRELLESDGPDALLSMNLEGITEIQLLIPDTRLILVPNFPDKDGSHLPHAETGVPHGEEFFRDIPATQTYNPNLTPKLRNLNRRFDPLFDRGYDSSYVGLIVRSTYFATDTYAVFANYKASYNCGVVAEVPDADVAKVQELLSKSQQQ
jgi:hypothetical protein